MHALELSILLHRALEARVARLQELLAAPGWRDDPEALHQVRVASRRLRAVLELVRPGMYPAWKRQGRKVRGLTRALGLTREMDVHALHLEGLAAAVPGMGTGAALEHALEVLDRKRRKARGTMARRLAGNPLKGLEELLEVPSLPDPFIPGDLAADAWERLDPLLESALSPLPGLLDREEPAALHACRIRIKRLRYALESLEGAFARPPEAQLQDLRALQSALGEHHDRHTLEVLLEGLWKRLSGRGRTILAAGTLELLAYVGEARLEAFERFRCAARGLSGDAFRASLRQALAGEAAP